MECIMVNILIQLYDNYTIIGAIVWKERSSFTITYNCILYLY